MLSINSTLFSTITSKDKSAVVEKLITYSTPSQDFYLVIVLAIAMAALGLILNNAAIVIGSMLISPILYALLSLSLGLSISDSKLIARSFFSIIKATIAGMIISALITLFAASWSSASMGMLISGLNPSLAYATVAFISGFTAAFTLTKPQLSETLPGIAIAVALIPPVAASGIGLATLEWEIFRNAVSLFALNMVAILAGSIIVFLLMNIYAKKELAEQTLKDETKRVEKDKKNIQNK